MTRPRHRTPRPAATRGALLVTGLALLAATHSLHAAPYTPQADSEVVETVRDRSQSAAQRSLRQLRAQLRSQPNVQVNLQANAQGSAPSVPQAAQSAQNEGDALTPAQHLRAALAYARGAIEQARREGDPRWLGSAQAALAPWWKLNEPPPAVRLLRATIRQSNHEFAASLADLDALINPTTGTRAGPARVPPALVAQARLTRASILQVQGRWTDAAADCTALADAAPLESAACLTELRSLGAAPQAAARDLARLAQAAPDEAARRWLALMQAELAERMGDAAAARAHYVQAQGDDTYTLGAYADYLLAMQRPAEVVQLLQGRERVDGLLLRLALAWQALGDEAQRAQAVATLQARFDAAHLRGERVHLREEARFELELKHRPAAALTLAQANWQVQKEPADIRLLAQAARAAGQPQALEPVRQFVREHGLADMRVQALLNPPVNPPGSTT